MFQIASLIIISTNSTVIMFSKLRSASLNCHLPKLVVVVFFTDPYCAGELISIAYCLFHLIKLCIRMHKVKVQKAKIRNPYNQTPHLIQDTIWDRDKNIIYKRAKRSAHSEQVTTRL